MTSIFSEYVQLFKKYHEKYGEKTAVLMMVGSFFEVYGIDNDNEKVGNAVELSRVLNVVLTRKNKKITENNKNNPLMLGFPCLALDKYVPVLLENDYTIVVVEQEKTSMGIRRNVRDVISPSTYMDSSDDSYLSLIYVDKHMHVGMSAINVTTGRSVVHECYSDGDDINVSLDETMYFLKQHPSKEVVFAGIPERDMLQIESYLGLGSVLKHYAKTKKNTHNVSYQNAVLGNVFKHGTMLSNIEYVDLESKPYALVGYVFLIEFVYDHNPLLLKKIRVPDIFVPKSNLVLATNTVDQLNVIGRGKHTLFKVMDNCSTSMGKRLLKRRLCAPLCDVDELETMYDRVDAFERSPDKQDIRDLLSAIGDVERMHRRMSVGILTTNEMSDLVSSYRSVLKLISLKPVSMSIDDEDILELVETCDGIFDFESAGEQFIRTFKKDVFPEVDELYDEIRKNVQKIHDASFGIEGSKVEYTRAGYHISVTNRQAKKMTPDKNFVMTPNKTTTRVSSADIDEASKKVAALGEAFEAAKQKRYKQVLNYLSSSYAGTFAKTASFVSEVDLVKSHHVTSTKYGYCRPIVDSQSKFGHVLATDLRHPIMERIDAGVEYVANDVTIGGDGPSGIVLYSMNSCGKTSLLKACGLSVVMAQAGCFVPASSYTFSPYECIMTRILSEDDMAKGRSSFVAEMLELRAILGRAKDGGTLVLADEITHGTEHTSGSAIFVSSVETLAARGVNFLFTTHLHNVYPLVKNVPGVAVKHLSVSFVDDAIVFERKLQDGPGDSMYGLEVCEFLNMDKKFVARAFEIRNAITPDKTDAVLKIKMSRYNKSKPVQCCEVCGYSPKLATDMPLDVHHIKKQSLKDCNDMISADDSSKIHKDATSNLVALCKQCHVKAHKDKLSISGYKQTSKGIILKT